jgi:hypothetical protein
MFSLPLGSNRTCDAILEGALRLFLSRLLPFGKAFGFVAHCGAGASGAGWQTLSSEYLAQNASPFRMMFSRSASRDRGECIGGGMVFFDGGTAP